MFLEKVRSEGISHFSYVVGDGGAAAVVDPRRDIEAYLEIAQREAARITHIFETHRNEDYLVGSLDLARRTGATIYHGGALAFGYGEAVKDGDVFALGDLRLRILETPGHTDESISIALYDDGFGGAAVGVFTGDTLFIGEVGRTDFYPDRKERAAGLLYDSIFEKLLPLGDQAIVYPAHGAGSVCGAGMAERDFSTLGYERKFNPKLQLSRTQFIREKAAENHYEPPYFKRMEQLNQHGAESLPALPRPQPMDADRFAEAIDSGMVVLDVRKAEAICGAFIPGSLAIPLQAVPSFAGWYLTYDQNIGLVTHDQDEVEQAVRFLVRLGYHTVCGYLTDGLHAWTTSGRRYAGMPTIHADDLKNRIETGANFTLLDVRGLDEFKSGHLPGASNIYVGELPNRIDEIPPERPVTTFCGSGQRAVIAAAILRQHGIQEVEVCLGSMQACSAVGCPVVTGEAA